MDVEATSMASTPQLLRNPLGSMPAVNDNHLAMDQTRRLLAVYYRDLAADAAPLSLKAFAQE
jgi:hypothetical protein